MSQIKRITWWCLSILEFVLKFVLLEKILKKVMVSRNFRQAHLQELGLMQIPRGRETLSIVRHVGLHLDFSSIEIFFGPLGLHLRV